MKIFIASDLHGDAVAVEKMLAAYRREGGEQLVLLGDLLYHGPRNDLPAGYAPKKVIALLNAHKDEILAVRGNCDAEVDQMVLDFPIMAETATLPLEDGREVLLTHGHHLERVERGVYPVILHGHTHVAGITKMESGETVLNPGSISIPKGGTLPSYILFDGKRFSLRALEDGREWDTFSL